MSSTSRSHKKDAPLHLRFGVAIVSTSRSRDLARGLSVSDVSGDLIVKLLVDAGHQVLDRSIIPDDQKKIQEWVEVKLHDPQIDAIITCGGTGVTSSDVTIETVRGLLDKELPGFGEIFRMLSFKRMGSAALMSRAIAGASHGKVVFCIPGSPDAAELAMTKLMLPESGHIMKHIRE
jgi:molybdenum cofactor biosynthesis protein B